MKPPISICMPVYNGEAFLSAAIESVLAQTETNFELIVCDDASTDRSPEIIKQYARQDGRVRDFYNQSNCGLFPNYNLCIQRAAGRYIKPFAQDDLLEATALERMKATLESHPGVSLVSVRRTLIGEDGWPVAQNSDDPSFDDYFPVSRPVLGRAVIREGLLPIINFIGEPATVMFRAESAKSFDCTLHHLGDIDLWLRLLIDGDMYFIPDSLCKFRAHAASASKLNNRTLMFLLDYPKIGRKFASILKQIGSNETEFLNKNIRSLSDHVALLESCGVATLAHLREQRETMKGVYRPGDAGSEQKLDRLIDDLLDYRELTFLSLAAASRTPEYDDDMAFLTKGEVTSGEDSFAPARKTEEYYSLLKRNQKLIIRLESRVRQLLSSYSWRLTKLFRDLNNISGIGNDDAKLAAMRELGHELGLSRASRGLHFQRLYLSYLRQQIACIKRSRSWRFTKPLRKLGVAAGLHSRARSEKQAAVRATP